MAYTKECPKETYLRPIWKAILIFLGITGIVAIVSFIMCFSLSMLLIQGTSIVHDTIFGDIPIWMIMSITFWILSPIISFLFYWPLVPHKYQHEQRQGMLPLRPDGTGQILFEPRRIEGKEPLWIDNYEFETTIHLRGTQDLSSGHGMMTWIVVEDQDGYAYLMQGHRFNAILDKCRDGQYHGNFTFDTAWSYPSIREVI